ncbi:MAG: PQQ-dependent sugar dehydrogenase [Proteobacteria bacterium]|nr:PQQ-dependent sugar dehydrogenase [Pseudomonadota bacterium]
MRGKKERAMIRFVAFLVSAFCFSSAALAADFTLPEGFRATVFADDLGYARHLAVREDGAVYTILRRRLFGPGLVAMIDDDGDGAADRVERFGAYRGTGVGFYKGYLYFATTNAVYRYSFEGDELVPRGRPEVVITGLSSHGNHAEKPFTFDQDGNIYVNFGAPSNACQRIGRFPGSRGINPCPQLGERAGIWRFKADRLGQTQADGERYLTGVRNALGLDWNFAADTLFFTTHGRDQLGSLWPDIYSQEISAELPAEEFHKAIEGADYGWPYTYYDHLSGARMVSPEYGGDGQTQAGKGKYQDPLLAFPGHWAPNDLLFYSGEMFPEKYRGGAFIAFHGSWNRSPFPQAGYRVVFIPFEDGAPAGGWETFAGGFAGPGKIASSGDAKYRPMGLAVGPEGELYISDSVEGRIWKITYKSD